MTEPKTPPDQAAILKAVCDRVLRRFAGKPTSPANARRMEIAIQAAVRRHPELASLHQLAPAVQFAEDGRPNVYFFQLPETANAA